MNYQEFILEVNKHREEKLNYLYGERNKPENYLPKDPVKDALKNKKVAQGKTLKQGNTYLAQLAPLKSTFVGPNLESLPHMDLRGPGQKLKSVINQKKFYDSEWGRLQGGPPKGP